MFVSQQQRTQWLTDCSCEKVSELALYAAGETEKIGKGETLLKGPVALRLLWAWLDDHHRRSFAGGALRADVSWLSLLQQTLSMLGNTCATVEDLLRALQLDVRLVGITAGMLQGVERGPTHLLAVRKFCLALSKVALVREQANQPTRASKP